MLEEVINLTTTKINLSTACLLGVDKPTIEVFHDNFDYLCVFSKKTKGLVESKKINYVEIFDPMVDLRKCENKFDFVYISSEFGYNSSIDFFKHFKNNTKFILSCPGTYKPTTRDYLSQSFSNDLGVYVLYHQNVLTESLYKLCNQ